MKTITDSFIKTEADSQSFLIALVRLLYKYKFRGDDDAANIVSAISGRLITPEGIQARVNRNFYLKGRDFEQCGKIRKWKREALIKRESHPKKDMK